MTTIEWSETASIDLERITDGYADIDPDLPDQMIARVATAAFPLRDNPRLGAPAGAGGLRKWSLRQTPFLLLYVIRGERIIVVRVVHRASDWVGLL